jgi:hypothetical protein
MIETVKSIGSIVGLLTGIFLIFDRYMRGRPIATLSFPVELGKASARIRIKNVGNHDVAILGVSVSGDVYGFANDLETINIARATVGRDQFFTLKPDETRELFLVSRFANGIPLELQPKKIQFIISWRRCNSTWLPQIPVFIFSDTTTIRKFGLNHQGA